jgi:hypothetical protein
MRTLSCFTWLLTTVLILGSLTSARTAATSNGDTSNGQQEPAMQQSSMGSAGDLQRAVQDPVASLISVPIQNKSNFGIGPYGRTQNVLNIQPVIPIRASENWNLIIRWITPVIWQPAHRNSKLGSVRH